MSRRHLNLAAQPFVNTRPVVRLSVLLWLVGFVILAGNLWLYWDFLTGRNEVHARLAQVDHSIGAERQRVVALDRELAGFDLARQNDQASFLNSRIERRRFSWSRLFDELAGILPQDVRLQSLRPVPAEEGARVAGRARTVSGIGGGDRVILDVDAQARTDQAILDFVDALFADPSFERPDLQRQATQDNKLIGFSLDVAYRPPSGDEAAGRAPGQASDQAPERPPGTTAEQAASPPPEGTS